MLTGVGVGSAWWALQGGTHPGSHHAAGNRGRAFLEAQSGHQKAPSASTSPIPGASAQPNRAQRRAGGKTDQSRPTLVVRTLGATSWVQVVDARGHVLVSHDVPPHQRLTFNQHHLDLTLGNAGAVALWIGRHYIDPAGNSGEVRHYTVR